jgi:hypothetical protein
MKPSPHKDIIGNVGKIPISPLNRNGSGKPRFLQKYPEGET